MFSILVEMWAMAEDEFDVEYCGEFLWSEGFASGQSLTFDDPRKALEFLSERKPKDNIPGFEYRYRIQQVDNWDGAFRDASNWT